MSKEKRIFVPPDLLSRASKLAHLEGVSVTSWCIRAIEVAVGVKSSQPDTGQWAPSQNPKP